MQRHLRGLAHRPHEQQQADYRQQRPGLAGNDFDPHVCELRSHGEHGLVVQTTEEEQHHGNAQQEAKVTDAVHQEGFEVGVDRRRAGIPETDQQVGHQTYRFPTEEQLHEVVAHHQHQHGEGKQRDIAEEAAVARVFMHVAYGIDVHHQRHEGHHHHHDGGQAIDQKTNFEGRVSTGEPGVHRAVINVPCQYILKHDGRQHERCTHAANGEQMRSKPRQHPAEQADHHRRQERQQWNEKVDFLHLGHISF